MSKPLEISFDQGTIVVGSGKEPKLDGLSLLRWDSRSSSYRGLAKDYTAIRTALQALLYEVVDTVTNYNVSPIKQVKVDLRPYQYQALDAWRAANCRGIVCLPTGAGKTLIGIAAILKLRQAALCVCPTRALMYQWAEAIERHTTCKPGIMGDGHHAIGSITVTTFQSAFLHMRRLGNRFGVIIVDEAHHFGHGVQDELLEMSTAPYRLGLSATLPEDDSTRQRLCDLIGPKVFQLSIQSLRGEYLSDYELLTIPVRLSEREAKHYAALMLQFKGYANWFRQAYGDCSREVFLRLSVQNPAGQRALYAARMARSIASFCDAKFEKAKTLLHQHRHQRVLIFTADTRSAYEVSRRLLIPAITGETKTKEREEIFAMFKSGTLPALVACRVLNEGIDVPEANVAILLGGSMGSREYIQRIGRVLRPWPGKKALILEIVAEETGEVVKAKRHRVHLSFH